MTKTVWSDPNSGALLTLLTYIHQSGMHNVKHNAKERVSGWQGLAKKINKHPQFVNNQTTYANYQQRYYKYRGIYTAKYEQGDPLNANPTEILMLTLLIESGRIKKRGHKSSRSEHENTTFTVSSTVAATVPTPAPKRQRKNIIYDSDNEESPPCPSQSNETDTEIDESIYPDDTDTVPVSTLTCNECLSDDDTQPRLCSDRGLRTVAFGTESSEPNLPIQFEPEQTVQPEPEQPYEQEQSVVIETLPIQSEQEQPVAIETSPVPSEPEQPDIETLPSIQSEPEPSVAIETSPAQSEPVLPIQSDTQQSDIMSVLLKKQAHEIEMAKIQLEIDRIASINKHTEFKQHVIQQILNIMSPSNTIHS